MAELRDHLRDAVHSKPHPHLSQSSCHDARGRTCVHDHSYGSCCCYGRRPRRRPRTPPGTTTRGTLQLRIYPNHSHPPQFTPSSHLLRARLIASACAASRLCFHLGVCRLPPPPSPPSSCAASSQPACLCIHRRALPPASPPPPPSLCTASRPTAPRRRKWL
ncbi:hypothetical protein DAI22_09g108950 [Oryza sativa Japonica Group]|nr:hypothetical protein DAI22_09g108950 [Oryza sativa Japonica Group]